MAYIIMKYDDLSQDSFDDFNRVAEFSTDKDWPVSMGLIGCSLENCGFLYKNKLKEWMNKGIELWNHGYLHTSDEFSSSSYEQQCQSVLRTQRLMKKELGYPAVTFGSPHNNSTETTIHALKNTAPEIKNYLFAVDGMSVSDVRQFLIRCDMETSTGCIDFDFLKKNYKELVDYPYMVIQGHPSFWAEKDFMLNEKVMRFLHDEGNIFVTPCHFPGYNPDEIADGKGQACAEELLEFIYSNKKIALYGAGEIGREIYRFLHAKGIPLETFIVSDGQKINEREICGLPVVPLSEFWRSGKDFGILLTMMPGFHQEVTSALREKGMKYFCFDNEKNYMRLVHYVRGRIF